MDIKQETHDGIVVVAPVGRLDSTTSDSLEKALIRVIEGGSTRVTVDFAGVDYISSAGLRVLLIGAKRLGAAKGRLVLCSLGESVRQVLDLAGFLPLFTVDATRDAALARLADPK